MNKTVNLVRCYEAGADVSAEEVWRVLGEIDVEPIG